MALTAGRFTRVMRTSARPFGLNRGNCRLVIMRSTILAASSAFSASMESAKAVTANPSDIATDRADSRKATSPSTSTISAGIVSSFQTLEKEDGIGYRLNVNRHQYR